MVASCTRRIAVLFACFSFTAALPAQTALPAPDPAAQATPAQAPRFDADGRWEKEEVSKIGLKHNACVTRSDKTQQCGRITTIDADSFTLLITHGPAKHQSVTYAYTGVRRIDQPRHGRRDAAETILIIGGVGTAAAFSPVAAAVIGVGILGILLLAMKA